jgi:hypothetical protein
MLMVGVVEATARCRRLSLGTMMRASLMACRRIINAGVLRVGGSTEQYGTSGMKSRLELELVDD